MSETFILTYFHTNNPMKVQYQLFCWFFYTAGSYQASVLYTSVYTCQSQSPNSAHHHPHLIAVFPPWCPYVHSLRLSLSLYSCLAPRFVRTTFFVLLDSVYMCQHTVLMIKTFKGKNTYTEFQWPLLAQADLRNSSMIQFITTDLALFTCRNLTR